MALCRLDNGKYNRRLTPEELDNVFTKQGVLETTSLSFEVKSILKNFNPPRKHWDELKAKWPAQYEKLQAELARRPATYTIPMHQRLYAWNDQLASDYIHSLIIDIPVHNLIGSKSERHNQDAIEDGQHRMVTIWRFVNNLFPYKPYEEPLYFYYDKIPTSELVKSTEVYSLTESVPKYRYQLDSRSISIKVASGVTERHLSLIFNFVNRGKPLKPVDRLYACIGSNDFMDYVKEVCEKYKSDLFEKHFGYTWERIETKQRTKISHVLAVIGTLAAKNRYDRTGDNKYLDVINGQYHNAEHVLALEDADIPKKAVEAGLELLIRVYDSLSDAKGMKYNKTFMAKNGGLLGCMILDIRDNYPVLSDKEKGDRFVNYWVRVINKIRETPNTPEHWYTRFHVAESGGANNVTGLVVKRRLAGLKQYVRDHFRIIY